MRVYWFQCEVVCVRTAEGECVGLAEFRVLWKVVGADGGGASLTSRKKKKTGFEWKVFLQNPLPSPRDGRYARLGVKSLGKFA